MTTSCVQGEVLDYQLCVNYEKEQETYPLIGDDTHTELTYFLKQMWTPGRSGVSNLFSSMPLCSTNFNLLQCRDHA